MQKLPAAAPTASAAAVFRRTMVTGGLVLSSALLSLLAPSSLRPAQAELADLAQGDAAELSPDLVDNPKAVLDQAWQIIEREYVDGTFNQQDWQMVRQDLLGRNYSSREEAYGALRKALEGLNDPYTRFMDPAQFQELTDQTAGELTGIGIRLGVNERSQRLEVAEPMAGSPAMEAGLRAGDSILAIDGESTEGMKVEDAVGRIRGMAGTEVRLSIGRDGGAPFEVAIIRQAIVLPIVTSAVREEEGGMKVGYIRLSEFSSHAAEQMQAAIESLEAQQVGGYVLDLRGNPGGLLYASIEIARMWLDGGTIVSTTDRAGNRQQAQATRSPLTDLPLVVLVDDGSASASEILTGALKDNRRATVVGEKTFGKALVQSVHRLADGSGIAVTVAHYYTPDGTDINKTGIEPDVALTLTDEQKHYLFSTGGLLGTNRDPYYARAVSILRTRTAVRDSVAPLTQRSSQ